MKELNDGELDRLLKKAYSPVEVSSDFTLKLWRRLIAQPVAPVIPVPAFFAAAAVAAGVLIGLLNWSLLLSSGNLFPGASVLQRDVRLDLFGNAPHDSLAASYLRLAKNGE